MGAPRHSSGSRARRYGSCAGWGCVACTAGTS